MKVGYSYLREQFAEPDAIIAGIRRETRRGFWTLGPQVEQFESEWARTVGTKDAVGVSNGTDAIALALLANGIGPGDTVATVANTFCGTVNAIIQIGARPILLDVDPATGLMVDDVPPGVDAVVPVHWSGDVSRVSIPEGVMAVYDGAQAVAATVDGKSIGGWGEATTYSLHPLKNINVWGDGGIVATDSAAVAERVRSLRNHGLADRDTWAEPGYNHRLSTIQAIVGLEVLKNVTAITAARRQNAQRYDVGLAGCSGVQIPRRRAGGGHVYHLYQLQADRRDALVAYLNEQGIEAKVHYPTPLHLQPAMARYGYGPGSLPGAEEWCSRTVSLPIHQYLSPKQIAFVCDRVRAFYG